MPFPDIDMPITVEAAFGATLTNAPGTWSFTDISALLVDVPISKRVGRSPGASTTDASAASLTLDNSDGALTPLNAASTYFPNVVLGLPIRITINPTGTPTEWFEGYADSWTPDLIPTTEEGVMLSVVRVTASGVLRRLAQGSSQGAKPLLPALHRAIIADGPSQFWPFTDGSDSTRPASALPDGVAMSPHSGTLSFGSADGPAGGPGPLLDMSAGALTVAFPTVGGTGYTLELIAKLTTAADPSDLIFRMRFASSINTMSEDADFIPNDGEWHHYLLAESQVGADVYRERWLDGVLDFDFTFPATTVLHPNALTLNVEPPFFSPMYIGYMAIHPHAAVDAAARYQAMSGFLGEMAHERVERLCTEAGVPVVITGTSSQTMGPQTVATLVDNLRECETVNAGGLGETGFGLHFVCLPERYNRPADLTIDLATYRTTEGSSDQVLRPTFDDQRYRNRWVVDRASGSSAVADVSGTDLVYEDSVTVNTETDSQLLDQASWRVYRDSIIANRYPNTPLDLGANPGLIDDWLTIIPGLGRIVRTNLPADHMQDDIDELVEGFSETLARRAWTAEYSGSPMLPYLVAELDDDDLGKLDTAGCQLVTSVSSAATSLTVHTSVLPAWTTDGGEMPIPIVVAGEVMSVTAIANEAAVSAIGAGTAAHASNTSITPSLPASLAAGDLLLCVAAIRNSGTGTVVVPSGYTELLTSGNVTVCGKYAQSGEAAPTVTFAGGVANATCSAQLIRINRCGLTVHASTAQLNSSAQNIAYPALDVSRANCVVLYVGWKQDDWTSVASPGTEIAEASTTTGDDQGLVTAYQIQTTATAIASGSFVVTGGVSAISRGLVLALATDRQTVTVTRSVNDVAKAQTTGAALIEYRGARLAL